MSARIEELTNLINDLRDKLVDPTKCGCDPVHLSKRLESALKELSALNESKESKDSLLKG